VTPPATPEGALLRWVQSIPAVRCVAPAFRPWVKAKDAAVVPITTVSGEKFGRAGFAGSVFTGLSVVAASATGDTYWVGRIPPAGAVVLHAGSEAQEDSFTAVVADTSAPPRTVGTRPAAPRLSGGIGLGSTRGAVEAVLGAGRSKTLCGFDIVRYEPRPQQASEAELWFFYRAGIVAAFARYEAV
jgi:hypothetical protein